MTEEQIAAEARDMKQGAIEFMTVAAAAAAVVAVVILV